MNTGYQLEAAEDEHLLRWRIKRACAEHPFHTAYRVTCQNNTTTQGVPLLTGATRSDGLLQRKVRS